MTAARYRNAVFLTAVHAFSELPADAGIEVAFAGRSNAGKSSVINRLCDHKRLARTSRTPGRTRQIVMFGLDGERRLVDLPGYGYARVPAELKRHWQALLDNYLRRRRSLRGLVLVMDCRHPLAAFDRQMIAWLQETGLPGHIVLNKADKLTRGQQAQAGRQVQQYLDSQAAAISVQWYSALRGNGIEELAGQLDQWYQWTGD